MNKNIQNLELSVRSTDATENAVTGTEVISTRRSCPHLVLPADELDGTGFIIVRSKTDVNPNAPAPAKTAFLATPDTPAAEPSPDIARATPEASVEFCIPCPPGAEQQDPPPAPEPGQLPALLSPAEVSARSSLSALSVQTAQEFFHRAVICSPKSKRISREGSGIVATDHQRPEPDLTPIDPAQEQSELDEPNVVADSRDDRVEESDVVLEKAQDEAEQLHPPEQENHQQEREVARDESHQPGVERDDTANATKREDAASTLLHGMIVGQRGKYEARMGENFPYYSCAVRGPTKHGLRAQIFLDNGIVLQNVFIKTSDIRPVATKRVDDPIPVENKDEHKKELDVPPPEPVAPEQSDPLEIEASPQEIDQSFEAPDMQHQDKLNIIVGERGHHEARFNKNMPFYECCIRGVEKDGFRAQIFMDRGVVLQSVLIKSQDIRPFPIDDGNAEEADAGINDDHVEEVHEPSADPVTEHPEDRSSPEAIPEDFQMLPPPATTKCFSDTDMSVSEISEDLAVQGFGLSIELVGRMFRFNLFKSRHSIIHTKNDASFVHQLGHLHS